MKKPEACLMIKDYIKPQLFILPLRESVTINELFKELDEGDTVGWYYETCNYKYIANEVELFKDIDKHFETIVNDLYAHIKWKKDNGFNE